MVTVSLNALLIFGLLGFPKMGIQGAAIATVIARATELVIIVIYAKKNSHILPFRIKYLFERNRLLFRDFIKYSMPVVANELLWGVAIATTVAVLGHLGSSVVAANSVTQVARQLATVITFGVANAAAIVVGKAIGENNEMKAKIYSKRFAWLAIIFGLLGSVVVLIARPISIHFLTLTPSAEGYLSFMMYIMTYFVVCQSYNAVMIVGNFRAGGDTKTGLIIDIFSMWLFSIPLGILAAFVFRLPVPLVYFILTSDELAKLIPSTIRFLSYKWLRNVTR
jgi:Na+-driven multidrug efflux pump